MESKLKIKIFNLICSVLNVILSFFFDKKYFESRFFKKSKGGYLWALRSIWQRNILRLGKPYPFPVSLGVVIADHSNLIFHPDDLNNFQSFGIYFQNKSATISLGKRTYIAPNVGLITANHNVLDLNEHDEGKSIIIGDNCWIGMNSVLLPGTILGPNTIVGAGSVVTKSFPDGSCVIAGNPARVIRNLDIDNQKERQIIPQ